MKLVSTIASLLTAALIIPLALSTRVTRYTSEAVEQVPSINAERFARGLPPLAPSKARKLGSPTRRTGTSPVPLTTYKGYIGIYQNDNQLGYLPKQWSGWYRDITNTPDERLLVSFTLPAGQSIGLGLNLLLENEPQSVTQSTPYLGLAAANADWIDPSMYPQAFFTSTVMTSGGPSGGVNALNWPFIESNVWSFFASTGALVPSWTTAEGVVKSDLWVVNDIFIGDGSDYSAIYPYDPPARGTFKFIPQ